MRDALPARCLTTVTPSSSPRAADRSAPTGLADAPSQVLLELLAHLRARVMDFVRERRGEGVSVERLIPEVRSLVREAESCEDWRDTSGILMAQMLWWSISAYYDEPELQHVPRFS